MSTPPSPAGHDDHNRVPPGPADIVYPTTQLAYLAFVKAAVTLADSAAALLTMSDYYPNKSALRACADVAHDLNRLCAAAAIYDHERELRDLTATEHQQAIDQWRAHIERPWRRYGADLISTLPAGLDRPDDTAAELDVWCERHLNTDDSKHHVSWYLRGHTSETEQASLRRRDQFLAAHEHTVEERLAHQSRQQRIEGGAYLSANRLTGYDDLADIADQPDHVIHTFWPDILKSTQRRHGAIKSLLAKTRCLKANDQTLVIGHPDGQMAASVLNLLPYTFYDATVEVLGAAPATILIADPSAFSRIARDQ